MQFAISRRAGASAQGGRAVRVAGLEREKVTMSNEVHVKHHNLNEWRRGFCELVAGKPFHISPERSETPYQVEDTLVVRETSRRAPTGYVAPFRISWIVRASDHRGAYEALLQPGCVVCDWNCSTFSNPSAGPAPLTTSTSC
jgi:hypothetical protein